MAAAASGSAVECVQRLLERACAAGASDLHVEPEGDCVSVRARRDGVLETLETLPTDMGPRVVGRLKALADLLAYRTDVPQEGRIARERSGVGVEVRVATYPTIAGERVALRFDAPETSIPSLAALGLPAAAHAGIAAAIARPDGVVLVTGPSGSGKTTTLYAALREIASHVPRRSVVTVEDPVERRIAGVTQTQVAPAAGLDFARALRSLLRQDPDVILVGEMRDQATVETGLRAAMTGHMVFSTLHTNDAISTPVRLIDMGAPRYMVALSLQLVIAQRLVRVICESCSENHTLLPNHLEWLRQELGGSDAIHPKRGKGCTHCNGTGYMGRTGIYEMLEMTAPVVQAANNENVQNFIEAAREQLAGNTLRRHAAMLAAAGMTTVEEAMRISNQFED